VFLLTHQGHISFGVLATLPRPRTRARGTARRTPGTPRRPARSFRCSGGTAPPGTPDHFEVSRQNGSLSSFPLDYDKLSGQRIQQQLLTSEAISVLSRDPLVVPQPCRLTIVLIQIGAKGDVQPFETG